MTEYKKMMLRSAVLIFAYTSYVFYPRKKNEIARIIMMIFFCRRISPQEKMSLKEI